MHTVAYSCQAFQETETAFIQAMERNTVWNRQDICPTLDRWWVRVHPIDTTDTRCSSPSWWIGDGVGCVLGYTHEDIRLIEIENREFRRGSLAHEMTHAFTIGFYGHAGHCMWGQFGIKKALREVTGETDYSNEWVDCVCESP